MRARRRPRSADEPPRPPTGEVRLGSGRVVDYTIHFDRNSLRDSLRLGDGLIALTSSGTLLRFELPAVRLVRERIGTEEVTCLGRGEGEVVLAGLSDGRVCRVDPATLDLTDMAKLPAAPRWIGWGQAASDRPAGLVVVTRRTTSPWIATASAGSSPIRWSTTSPRGRRFALEEEATTFLLDRAGRFWLGADRGEWGGRVTRVDLVKGTVADDQAAAVPRIRGSSLTGKAFTGSSSCATARSGPSAARRTWASTPGVITRIDGVEPRRCSLFEPPRRDPSKSPTPIRPSLPITHIVEENGGLLVFSYSDVFRVDKALKSWKKVATLEIQYRWGRPDAVGSYPSVRAVHPPTARRRALCPRHGRRRVRAPGRDEGDPAALSPASSARRASTG